MRTNASEGQMAIRTNHAAMRALLSCDQKKRLNHIND